MCHVHVFTFTHMSCLRPRADSDFAGDMLSTFAASERWLPVVRPLVTAQPVADCAPGVAVLVSKAVSEVLQPLRDSRCSLLDYYY